MTVVVVQEVNAVTVVVTASATGVPAQVPVERVTVVSS